MKKSRVLLVFALCFTLLSSVASAYTLSANDEFPLVDEKTEINVWTHRQAHIVDFESCYTTDYYEDKTNVHINWTQVPQSERVTTLNLSLASGDYPDIYGTYLSTDQLLAYADDVFIPLNDLIEEYAPNTKRILEENEEIRKAVTAPNGNIYSLFKAEVSVHSINTRKMYAENSWMDAYGKVPETTEEFKEMLIYFRDHDMNGNGDPSDEIPMLGNMYQWGSNPLNYIMNAFQFTTTNKEFVYAEDDQIVFCADTDGWREGLKYFNDLYTEGLLAEETFTLDTTQYMEYCAKEAGDRLVGVAAGAWQGCFVTTPPLEWDTYKTLAPLEGPTGLRQATDDSLDGTITSLMLMPAITVAAKDPALCMRYIDQFMTDDWLNNPLHIGFEGVDWAWDDSMSLSGTTPARKPLAADETASILEKLGGYKNSTYANHTFGYMETFEARYSISADKSGSEYWLYDGHLIYEPYYRSTGIPSQIWAADAAMAEEMNELQSAIGDFVMDSYVAYTVGTRDIHDDADWQAYLNELENIGLSRYLELKQLIIFG